MKTVLKYSLVLLAGLSVALSCSKIGAEDAIDGDNAAPAGKQIIIHATLADAPTRVEYTLDESGEKPKLTLKWESTDALIVRNASGSVEIGNPTIDETGKTATFSGTLPEGGEPYTVLVKHAGSNLGATQTQAQDGDLKHLEYAAKAENVTEADFANLALAQTTGVLGLIAKLPTDVSATVKAVIFQTENNLFNGSNTLTVNLSQGGAGVDNILYVYANVAASSIPADTEMFIRFKVGDGENDYYTRYQVFASDVSLTPGALNGLKLNCSHIDRYAGKDDKGTEDAPYLIADKYQMLAMKDLMKENKTTCFSLLADIDLANEAWTPLNIDEGFARAIRFNGNGHTVSNLTCAGVPAYPSFVGVLSGSVRNLTFDKAKITGGSNTAGVLAGYVGSASASLVGDISDITVKNSEVTGAKRGLGGVAGYISKVSETVKNCHAINTTVTSTADRVGGLFGQVEKTYLIEGCTAEDVTVSGTINIGGLVGVGYGNFTDCTSSGSISSINTTSNTDIALGGLVGYFENGTISHCNSSVNAIQDTNGRDIGGLVGKMLAGTIEKSFATGDMSGIQRNVGGLVGLITNTSGVSTISDCYCTGSVKANSYAGGFLGLFEKGSATITNCYATGDVAGSSFGVGGLIGVIGGAGFIMSKSAAWNTSVVPTSYGSGNWSSGSVAAVTFPTCTLTDNYRNPAMSLTAWWVPDADYSHPDVSSSTPLVVKDIATGELRPTTATGTGSGNDNYPQFAYHGKVEAGKSLSQLASTMLGWSSSVWDFTGDLPTLK